MKENRFLNYLLLDYYKKEILGKVKFDDFSSKYLKYI